MKSYEPKFCELCGKQFLREIGTKIVDCAQCTAKSKGKLEPNPVRTESLDIERSDRLEEQRKQRAREEFAKLCPDNRSPMQ